MRNVSRIPVGTLLVLAVLTGLDGCGADDAPDPRAATTDACRSYVLTGGADDQLLANELLAVTTGDGGYDAEVITSRLRAIRAAAAKAGLTADLPVRDYRLLRGVVVSALALEAEVSPASDAVALDPATMSAFRKAADAVHKRCD